MAFPQAVPPAVDERRFSVNFSSLFGGVIVLPDMPRNYQVRAQNRW